MKKLYSLFLFLAITGTMFSQSTDLYFSKYGEGSSNHKFLEIYNGTGSAVDLGNYSLSTNSNGADVANQFDFPNNLTFAPGTMLADGDVFVIAHPSADASILAIADVTFQYLSNGDDTMALTLAGATADTYTIIDIIGDMEAEDIGAGWAVAGVPSATANHTLTRKASICSPNPTPLGSFGTDASDSEWIVTDSNTGWDTLGSHIGCVSDPVLAITAPGDGQIFDAGTTTVTLSMATENFTIATTTGGGDGHIHWTVNGNAQPMKYDLNDETINVTNGGTYTVYAELVDNSHTPITPAVNQTITFSVSFPCDIVLSNETASCDAETSGLDTYTATVDFTGGGSSNYTVTVNDGTVGGDDPSSNASGTIVITGVTEGTNLEVHVAGDPSDSACDFTWYIDSPSCIGGVICANPGDIIITEIMQNPVAVNDNVGEYFEVYNTTSSDINMQGWEIYDLGSDSFTVTALIVPANSYAVLSLNSDVNTNGGVTVDYEYSGFTLGNGEDEIIIACSGNVIDQVIYDGGSEFPDPTGASMELASNAYDATSNDIGSNWGEATSVYGSGDLGTPGFVNDFLDTDNFASVQFKVYPNPVNNGIVNIKSNNAGDVHVTLFNMLGKQVVNTTLTNEQLNVSNLNKGIYLLKVTQGNTTTTQKLVIK